MESFKFEIDDQVTTGTEDGFEDCITGPITGRVQYKNEENQYFIEAPSIEKEKLEGWYPESDIRKVD